MHYLIYFRTASTRRLDLSEDPETTETSTDWKYGICECLKLPSTWRMIGCCFPQVLIMRIGDHTKGVSTVTKVLLLWALTVYMFYLGTYAFIVIPVALVCLVMYIRVLINLRTAVRKRYNIRGTRCKDCCNAFFCSICSLIHCQMFHEVAEREQMILV